MMYFSPPEPGLFCHETPPLSTRIRYLLLGGRRDKAVYLEGLIGYTAGMTKRLVEIDDELLARARTVAGTDTIRATVEAALKRLVDQDTALLHVARLRKPGALDIDALNEARRPRTGTHG